MSHHDHTVTLTTTRLEDFRPGDRLHCRRKKNDFQYFMLVEFIRLDRGSVDARVIANEPPGRWVPQEFRPGALLRFTKASACLWGVWPDDRNRNSRFHWYCADKGWT